MDFISKVSEKAEETFQSIKESDVTKKAINYAGIPGLQIKVGRAEADIRKAYQEIGKLYFEAHGQEEDTEYTDLVTLINAKKELIAQLKAEIEEKKKSESTKKEETGTKEETVCPICNHVVPEGSAFCNICGHQF